MTAADLASTAAAVDAGATEFEARIQVAEDDAAQNAANSRIESRIADLMIDKRHEFAMHLQGSIFGGKRRLIAET